MGLFNKKQKTQKTQEIINDFNYDKMMKAAKGHKLFESSKLYNVIERPNSVEGTQHQYEFTSEETELIGIYNKNNKLIVVLKYDLEQKILFNYLLYCGHSLDFIYDVIKVSKITIEERDETLLSNYSNIEILRYIRKVNNPYCADEICPMTGKFIKNINVGGTYLECSIDKTMLHGYEEPTKK